MSAFPYELTETDGAATLGLIVLQVDETIEHDFRRLIPESAALHVSRVASGDELTPETIAAMKTELTGAARLLPPAALFDVVGYACTSGTTLIGAEAVAGLVGAGCRAKQVSEPLSAAIAAARALGVRRLAVVSPYVDSVARPICAAFSSAGLDVPASVSFGEKIEARVARISRGSLRAAAMSVAEDADAVFLSCTNLRTLDVIDALEDALERPVLSSNQVLAWHMGQLAGLPPLANLPGRLRSASL